MTSSVKSVHITVIYADDSEMAWTFLHREQVFCGNLWDYHSGCSGSVVGGYDLEPFGWEGRRPPQLVEALTAALTADGFTITSEELSFEETQEAEGHMASHFAYERMFTDEHPEAWEEDYGVISAPFAGEESGESNGDAQATARDEFAEAHHFLLTIDGERWGATTVGWTHFLKSEDGRQEFGYEGEEVAPTPEEAEAWLRGTLLQLKRSPHGFYEHRGATYDLRPNGQDYCWVYRDGEYFTEFSYWNTYSEAKLREILDAALERRGELA